MNYEKKYEKRNAILFILSIGIYYLFSAMLDSNVLSYILSDFVSSKFLIGLFFALNSFAYMILQLPTAKIYENRTWEPITVFKVTNFLDILFTLGLYLIITFLYGTNIFIILFYLIYFIYRLNWSIMSPTEYEAIDDTISKKNINKFFATKSYVKYSIGLLSLILTYFVIQHHFDLENNYSLYYLLLTIGSVMYFAIVAFLKKPKITVLSKEKREKRREISYKKILNTTLKKDKEFRSYVVSLIPAVLTYSFYAFIVVLAKEQLNITMSDVFLLAMISILGKIVFTYILGKTKIIKNYKAKLIFFRLTSVLCLVMLLFIHYTWLLYIIFALYSLTMVGEDLIAKNVIELKASNHVAAYSAIHGIVTEIGIMMGALITGAAIDFCGYSVAIVIACVIMMISIILVRHVKVDVNSKQAEEK